MGWTQGIHILDSKDDALSSISVLPTDNLKISESGVLLDTTKGSPILI